MAITVDKTPASVWVMGLSARLFGVNSWSILVPQALMGVATVWLLYAAVRRVAGRAAGLLAGVVLALTPVAVLMFRFNNPDALLVLLLTAGAYAMVRAIESGRTRWLVLAGACVGFGFLTKMLQAFLVLPAFARRLRWSARARAPDLRPAHGVGRAGRLRRLVGAAGVAVAGGDRPYIGGSQNNSVLELTLGYNGFGRLTGDEVGSVGGGGRGSAGWGRLFGAEMAGGIAWLLPAAVVLLVAGLWLTRRSEPAWTSLLLWGGWLVVTAVVFSYMNGIIHAYYTVALAPAVAAVLGIGAVALWRQGFVGAAVLSGAVALTAVQTYLLLDSVVLLVIGLLAAALLLVTELRLVVAAFAVVVALSGPAAYSLQTAAATHSASHIYTSTLDRRRRRWRRRRTGMPLAFAVLGAAGDRRGDRGRRGARLVGLRRLGLGQAGQRRVVVVELVRHAERLVVDLRLPAAGRAAGRRGSRGRPG